MIRWSIYSKMWISFYWCQPGSRKANSISVQSKDIEWSRILKSAWLKKHWGMLTGSTCFFHWRLSIPLKSKVDIMQIDRYWKLKNILILLIERTTQKIRKWNQFNYFHWKRFSRITFWLCARDSRKATSKGPTVLKTWFGSLSTISKYQLGAAAQMSIYPYKI